MIHRVDPPIHTSRKGNINKAVAKGRTEEGGKLSSRRKAPAMTAGKVKGQYPITGGRRRKGKEVDDYVIGHVKFKASTAKPKQAILDRLRRRIADSIHATRCKDDENVKAVYDKNEKHVIEESKDGHPAKHVDKEEHRVSTREGFVDHLKKLAAYQKA